MEQLLNSRSFGPRDAEIAMEYTSSYLQMTLATIDGDFGGWKKAQAGPFDEDGTFDAIFAQIKR